MNQNESVKKLEVGKDYVNVHNSKFIVIDRAGDLDNKGFYYDLYKKDSPCTSCGEWREATELEVIEAFEKHLNHRFGEDWRTMKIKEKHPSLSSSMMMNDGLWDVEISKYRSGWYVWNKNGLLYCNGIWVERLEDIKAMKKKEKTVTITDIMADFLDSIRAYEHESGEAIYFDERESSEFVDIYFNSEGEINIEEKEPLFITEDGVGITDGMQSVITIDSDFNVDYTRYQWANKTHLIFGSKEGADRYIWKNKRVFSYNDLRSWNINGEIQEEALKVAKERGKE